MENSNRFFNNTDCKYFPCHSVDNENDFNCLFCYCPLYNYENCGGKYKLCNGIKNCIDCIIPHSIKGYDYINRFLKDINSALKK